MPPKAIQGMSDLTWRNGRIWQKQSAKVCESLSGESQAMNMQSQTHAISNSRGKLRGERWESGRRRGLMTYEVGANDEALGRVSDIAEWITGDEVQLGSTRRLEHRSVVRWNDRSAGNSVSISTFHSTDLDFIASVNALQHSKMSVSMAGNYAVTFRAGHGGTLKMAWSAAQRAGAGTLDYI